MSGTDITYGVISLRPRYAMSGTDIACGASRPQRLQRRERVRATLIAFSLLSYAFSGTDECLPCYAMSGTEIRYAATRRVVWLGHRPD
eukprot:1468634-Rhodomonas_salina.3